MKKIKLRLKRVKPVNIEYSKGTSAKTDGTFRIIKLTNNPKVNE